MSKKNQKSRRKSTGKTPPAPPKAASGAAGRRPSTRLVQMVESGLHELAELVGAHVELLREAAGEGQTPQDRSRAVADIERLVRASERLRALLGDVKSARTVDAARTLLEFMRKDEAAAGRGRGDPPPMPDGTAA